MNKWLSSLRGYSIWRRVGLALGAVVLIGGLFLPGRVREGQAGAPASPLLVVVGGGALFWWFSGRRHRRSESHVRLHQRDRMKLGSSKSLHLLEVDGRNLLIACCPDRVQVLARWQGEPGKKGVNP